MAELATAGPFLPPGATLTARIQGNLGEFIAMTVAVHAPIQHTQIHAVNAFQPLQDISLAGLDVTYLYFDAGDPTKDCVYVQEVKTTGSVSLSYADNLTEDYRKLFEDNPKFTLNTRIQGLAFKLAVGDKRDDLADRLRSLVATEAKACTQVKLLPTLVHERNRADPVTKLLAIKTAISTLGWSASQIQPWSIALRDLVARLTRIARGQR